MGWTKDDGGCGIYGGKKRMFSIMANPGNLHLYMSYDEDRYFRVSGGSH